MRVMRRTCATTSARRTNSGSRRTPICDGPQLLDEFRAVTGRRLETLRALTPEQWDAEGFTPEGPGPYRQFMAIRVFDCWYHDQDIREALGRPGFLEGEVADLSLARIPPKGLGYIVGKKAGAPAGTTVAFVVEGHPADHGRDLGSARGEGRAPRDFSRRADRTHHDRPPHVRAPRGRSLGRSPRACPNGVVRVEGDTDLGDRVVDNMAFTI